MAWSPDIKRIASGNFNDTAQVWKATDGSQVYTYRGHHDDHVHAVWSPDGKRIASEVTTRPSKSGMLLMEAVSIPIVGIPIVY